MLRCLAQTAWRNDAGAKAVIATPALRGPPLPDDHLHMLPTVRSFTAGDESQLVEVWTRAHAGYVGYVRRTVDYWRWCILERPGVTADDIIVLAVDRGPVAYGVLGPDGSVLELAVDPELAGDRREAVAAKLIRALEDRCRARGREVISFALPDADDAVQRRLRGAGYRTQNVGSFTATILDVAVLLAALLRHRQHRCTPGWSPTFRLEIDRGPARVYPRLVLRVSMARPPTVEIESPNDRHTVADAVTCTVSTDLSTLNRIVFRRDTVDGALAEGLLVVRPQSCEHDVRTLMGLVTLTRPWYTPSADVR